MPTLKLSASGGFEANVALLAELLDFTENLASNDERARTILGSNWFTELVGLERISAAVLCLTSLPENETAETTETTETTQSSAAPVRGEADHPGHLPARGCGDRDGGADPTHLGETAPRPDAATDDDLPPAIRAAIAEIFADGPPTTWPHDARLATPTTGEVPC